MYLKNCNVKSLTSRSCNRGVMATSPLLKGEVPVGIWMKFAGKKAQGHLCTSSQMQRANIKQLPVPPEESINGAKRAPWLEEKGMIHFTLNDSIYTYAQVCFKEIIDCAAECYRSPHNSLTSLVLTCQAMSPYETS